jgi:dihydroorotase
VAGPAPLLVRGARVLERESFVTRDLLLEAGMVRAVEPEIRPPSEVEILDARGLVALPGAVDLHVHFREPGAEAKEDFASGTLGALHGGITTVVEVQNSEPLLLSRDAVRAKRALVGPKARVHFGLYGNVEESSLGRLREVGEGALGFKIFMGRSVGPCGMGDLASLCRAFEEIAATGKVVAIHAESDAVNRHFGAREPSEAGSHARRRPALSEALSIAAALELAREFRTNVHVFHVSSRRGVEAIERAKAAGVPVTASTCPHYLLFSEADVREKGNFLKVNPPIRSLDDQDALWEGLRSGAIDALTTDHAPHLEEEKRRSYEEAPSGIPSVDVFLPLLLTEVDRGSLTLGELVAWTSQRPAEVIGLPQKGRLETGADADLVLADVDHDRVVGMETLRSKSRWSPYTGRTLLGWPVHVVLRGRVALRSGEPVEGVLGDALP